MVIEIKSAARRTLHLSPSRSTGPSLKIAYIGGGSVGWAWILMNDLAVQPHLNGEVVLYDIDFRAAKANEAYGALVQSSPEVKSRWKYRAVSSPEAALKGADVVIMSILPGTFAEMEAEIGIARRYGLVYPVGDTVGAPGYMRALRAVPIYAGYARLIKTFCPKAWVINYTNPMSVCTRTLTRVEPSLRVFGCCHEVFGTQRMLARLVSRVLKVPEPPREDIQINVLGINHFTWINRARWKGHDLLSLLREDISGHKPFGRVPRARVLAAKDYFYSEHQIAYALFERYGILPAAGDRHLAEFVPGFLKNDMFRWGIRTTPVRWRRIRMERVRRGFAREVKAGRPPKIKASGEEGVCQISALSGLFSLTTNVNLENRGQIPNLPAHACVETNARFSKEGIRPLPAGPVPEALAGIMGAHVHNQELIVEAALEKDRDKAFLALFNDPTVRLPIDRAYRMFVEMLSATRRFLTGWKHL